MGGVGNVVLVLIVVVVVVNIIIIIVIIIMQFNKAEGEIRITCKGAEGGGVNNG